MADAAMRSQLRDDQVVDSLIDQPAVMCIPIGDEDRMVPALGATKTLLATNNWFGVLALRHGEIILFRQLSPQGMRDWALDPCRAADALDQGKGTN